MKTVEIPGGTAELRETHELRARDRQLVRAASMAAGTVLQKMAPAFEGDAKTEEGRQALAEARAKTAEAVAKDASLGWQEWLRFLEFRQSVVVAQLASWTRDEPLPTMDTIGDLDPDLFDALDAAVGGVPASVAETDFSPSPDPESPTNGSSDSAGPSKDAPMSPSTPTPGNDTSPTATESSSPE